MRQLQPYTFIVQRAVKRPCRVPHDLLHKNVDTGHISSLDSVLGRPSTCSVHPHTEESTKRGKVLEEKSKPTKRNIIFTDLLHRRKPKSSKGCRRKARGRGRYAGFLYGAEPPTAHVILIQPSRRSASIYPSVWERTTFCKIFLSFFVWCSINCIAS